jgi:hypothetical protein
VRAKEKMTAGDSNSISTFRLRGKTYRLSKVDVEKAATMLLPRPTEKYAIGIEGRFYSPK